MFADVIQATTAWGTPITIDVKTDSVNKAKYGTCEITQSGNQVKYTPPDSEFEGWDRCAYIVCSVEGEDCAKGIIEVWVMPSPIYEQKPQEQQAEEVPQIQTAELIIEEPDLEMVYAEDESVTTSLNTPIIVDVTSNDFVQGMGELEVTDTGGAEHGRCRLTDDNQIQYIPDPGFIGTDHCGYIVCQNSICDEGIAAIKVMNQWDEIKPLLQEHAEQQQPSSSGLVSNYESSGGMTLAKHGESSSLAQAGSIAVQQQGEMSAAEVVDCEEVKDNGRGRNLRGEGRRRRLVDPCPPEEVVQVSTVATHKKKRPE